ncbi:MAG: hypothetical protein M3037_09720 [Gemmatimonadota bacterium]|nr:hypothetical protein [Gemmatimonadota bacterium]
MSSRTVYLNAGDYVPDAITVALLGLPPDRKAAIKACEGSAVTFRQSLNPSKPDTIRPRYNLGVGVSPSLCVASIRWLTASRPGKQELDAEIVGAGTHEDVLPSLPQPYARVLARVDEPAHLVVGLADMFKPARLGNDSAEADLKKALQAIVGADFSARSILPFWHSAFAEQLRPMIATSVKNIGKDLYLGVQLSPLMEGPAAMTSPVQLSVGVRRIQKARNPYYFMFGGTYNANSLISTILKGFSFPT